MHEAKPARISMRDDVDIAKRPPYLDEAACTKYQSILNSLVHPATKNRPYPCVAASVLDSLVARPTMNQMTAAHCKLRYLTGRLRESSLSIQELLINLNPMSTLAGMRNQ